MSDPLERAIERGTQRRLLSEIANLRAKLAQAEEREAEDERVIVGLNKQLTEQFELSTKYVGISEECRAALSTARAEAEAMREALEISSTMMEALATQLYSWEHEPVVNWRGQCAKNAALLFSRPHVEKK